jgi:hypothetical protein
MKSPAWSGTGPRLSAATLGLFVGAIVSGMSLWLMLAINLVNRGPAPVLGWGFLMTVGPALPLLAPLAVIAFSDGSASEWAALTAGSAFGAVAGLVALYVPGAFSGGEPPLAALVIVSIAAAVLAVALALRTLPSGQGVLLVFVLVVACLAFALPLRALLIGKAGESTSFWLAGLVSPFGLAAGIGAWGSCALGRLTRAGHMGQAIHNGGEANVSA